MTIDGQMPLRGDPLRGRRASRSIRRSAIAAIAAAMPARRWSAGRPVPERAVEIRQGEANDLRLVRAWPAPFLRRLRHRPVLHQRSGPPGHDRHPVGHARRSRRAPPQVHVQTAERHRLDGRYRTRCRVRALSRARAEHGESRRLRQPSHCSRTPRPEALHRVRARAVLTLQSQHWRNKMRIQDQTACGRRDPRASGRSARRPGRAAGATQPPHGQAQAARRRSSTHGRRHDPGHRPTPSPAARAPAEQAQPSRRRGRAQKPRDRDRSRRRATDAEVNAADRDAGRGGRPRPDRRSRPATHGAAGQADRHGQPTTQVRPATQAQTGTQAQTATPRPRPPAGPVTRGHRRRRRAGAPVRDQRAASSARSNRPTRQRGGQHRHRPGRVPLASFGQQQSGPGHRDDHGPARSRGAAAQPADSA